MNRLAGGEMFAKRLWIAVLTVVTILVASAVSQDEKNEIGGTLGRTFISDQGIKGGVYPGHTIAAGKGLSINVEYARRFLVTPVYATSGRANQTSRWLRQGRRGSITSLWRVERSGVSS